MIAGGGPPPEDGIPCCAEGACCCVTGGTGLLCGCAHLKREARMHGELRGIIPAGLPVPRREWLVLRGMNLHAAEGDENPVLTSASHYDRYLDLRGTYLRTGRILDKEAMYEAVTPQVLGVLDQLAEDWRELARLRQAREEAALDAEIADARARRRERFLHWRHAVAIALRAAAALMAIEAAAHALTGGRW